MKLISLTLENFKGCRSFRFEPNGKSTTVYGENATGKTTLFDAYSFLLTGLDSLDQSPKLFDIKPLVHGEPEHGLAHSVEGVFLLDDGEEVSLKRVYAEKWAKKHGQATRELTGHTTQYFINGTPQGTERQYNDYVASIVPPNLFKILSNIRHFNERLDWPDRRKILLEVCGDVADSDIIDANPELSRLPAVLGKKSVEDWRKTAAAQKTKINEELTAVPTRIDEASRGKAEVAEGVTRVSLKAEEKTLQTQISGKRAEIDRVKNGGEIAEKTKKLREVEGQLIALTNRETEANEKPLREKRAKLNGLQESLMTHQNEVRRKNAIYTETGSEIARLLAKRETLLSEYRQIRAEEFSFTPNSTTCPTCGQDLPESQIEEAGRKALAAFSESRAKRLEANKAAGLSNKAKIDELQAVYAGIGSQITEHNASIADLEQTIKPVTDEPLPESQESPQIATERQKLLTGKEILEAAISELNQGNHDVIAEIEESVKELEVQLAEKQAAIAQIEGNQRADSRIRELKESERKLSADFEQLEAGIFLTDLFVRKKVEALNERINSRFPSVRFKMAEVQVNGAINDKMCTCTIGGVPYPSLNEASRIAAGCEIAEVLSEHYGVWLPRWIDGAESILDIPQSQGQVISLVVSEGDKTLRVKTEE